jgi:hypothetical protein
MGNFIIAKDYAVKRLNDFKHNRIIEVNKKIFNILKKIRQKVREPQANIEQARSISEIPYHVKVPYFIQCT